VFTNLAPEHLNFHGSMEAYAEAKSRLFGMLDSPTQKDVQRFGVVNADDPASVVMVGASPAAIVSYALDYEADVRATELELGLGGTRFQLVSPIDELEVETRLVGRHNVYNWLAAACVALGWGIDLEAVVEAAASVEAPRGRMERVQAGQRFEVIVDFAHTPQALETTLRTLRDIALPSGSPWVSPPPRRFAPPQPSPVEGEGAGRVPPTSTGGIRPHPTPLPEGEGAGAHPWRGRAGVGGTFSPALYLVFGMAGGRDAANRPRMGELAARYAEFFVISTDDPIHEDPAQIAADVAAGARAAGAVDGEQFVVELDRRAAIELVLRRARPGDVVLLAGKGHEQRMLVGDRAEPWNDEAVARDILGEMGFE
jgi:UDP-N-acetylmuramyl tripeptide synthase